LIQYDSRGSGRSQRDVRDLSMEAMLRDLDAVVSANGLERVDLVGMYHSCLVAIEYAARHPERVGHLVLFGGSARGWELMRGPGTQALLILIERDWDTFVESITHAWLGWPEGDDGRLAAAWFRNATTPDVARTTLQVASGTDLTERFAAVRCPVLVLHRRDATVIPLEVSTALAAGFPDGRLEVLNGSSASLFFERADVSVERILAFVGAETGGGPRAGGTAGSSSLSPRETEVLRRIAAGDTNAEIAHRLGISENTVERHATNLYRKIEVRGRAEATAYAIRHGIA
jgi:DNA-binding CsgD family transcriptional regulator/pimeloyl-ACP methyl ester carboxylesterase